MIRIMDHLDPWADIEVIDGRLRVVSYDKDPQSIWWLLDSVRHDGEEVYNSLPHRMQGFVLAFIVD
jgi:hypothetical protein